MAIAHYSESYQIITRPNDNRQGQLVSVVKTDRKGEKHELGNFITDKALRENSDIVHETTERMIDLIEQNLVDGIFPKGAKEKIVEEFNKEPEPLLVKDMIPGMIMLPAEEQKKRIDQSLREFLEGGKRGDLIIPGQQIYVDGWGSDTWIIEEASSNSIRFVTSGNTNAMTTSSIQVDLGVTSRNWRAVGGTITSNSRF